MQSHHIEGIVGILSTGKKTYDACAAVVATAAAAIGMPSEQKSKRCAVTFKLFWFEDAKPKSRRHNCVDILHRSVVGG